MAAAYEIEYSPLIHKLLDMIPKVILARNAFSKDDPRYKELDETADKLISKLGGLFLSNEREHLPVMHEEITLPGQEDDLPDTYTPTENTSFDTIAHLREAVSGPLNETIETSVRETPEQRKERKAKEEKEQQDADELAERWNAGGRKSRNQKKSKRKSKRRRRMRIL
jgi:hypothetical protein